MILIYHKNNRVCEIVDDTAVNTIVEQDESLSSIETLFMLGKRFPDSFIGWCHEDLKDYVNVDAFHEIFKYRHIMASFEASDNYYISDRIGYVESTPFINVNRKVTYPTWFMSDCIGAIHAEVLSKFDYNLFKDDSFIFALNSIAKLGMPNGLWCYSEPRLLVSKSHYKTKKASTKTLFRFVKQHYNARWVWLLFMNSVIYDKKWPVFSLVLTLLYRKRNCKPFVNQEYKTNKNQIKPIQSIDVIIPTLGRKEHLLKVLQCLKSQTVWPQRVIVIEQNPDESSETEFNELFENQWPFVIKHHFIHQTGACHARNIAFNEVKSKYVFLADDDIVFDSNLLEQGLNFIQDYKCKAITLSCLQKNEVEIIESPIQWSTFGSGCSIVNSDYLKNVKFNVSYEHGYGEDADFGMQLRSIGVDIIYVPKVKILHLKAPIGGFRSTNEKKWDFEKIKPKPSPTIMLFNLKHQTRHQLRGYRTILLIKFYWNQPTKNPISYYKNFSSSWHYSTILANDLLKVNTTFK